MPRTAVVGKRQTCMTIDTPPPPASPPLPALAPVLCADRANQVRLDGHGPDSSIPVNSEDIAVPFETPLFKGRLLVRVAGLPGDGAQDYFRGKKRLMQCAVQVRCRAWEWLLEQPEERCNACMRVCLDDSRISLLLFLRRDSPERGSLTPLVCLLFFPAKRQPSIYVRSMK